MEGFLATWIVPFTFIPGVAGLILSTSNRFFHVNSLIRELSGKGREAHKDELVVLLKRTKCFHSALTFFYISIGCFSISALIGNLHQKWMPENTACVYAADGLILTGVVCVVFASAQMVRESALSYKMIRKQAKTL